LGDSPAVSPASRYLLDTTILVDLSRDREPVASWLRAVTAGPDEIGLSTVVAEFFAGLRPDVRPRWERFTEALVHWDVTREIAIRAGVYRYEFARGGCALHIPDALIAATAATVGAVLVTDNVKDFPMRDVQTLSVRSFGVSPAMTED